MISIFEWCARSIVRIFVMFFIFVIFEGCAMSIVWIVMFFISVIFDGCARSIVRIVVYKIFVFYSNNAFARINEVTYYIQSPRWQIEIFCLWYTLWSSTRRVKCSWKFLQISCFVYFCWRVSCFVYFCWREQSVLWDCALLHPWISTKR